MDEVYELTFNPVAAISLAVAIAMLFSLIIAFFFLGSDLLHVVADSAVRIRAVGAHLVRRIATHGRPAKPTQHSDHADLQTQE